MISKSKLSFLTIEWIYECCNQTHLKVCLFCILPVLVTSNYHFRFLLTAPPFTELVLWYSVLSIPIGSHVIL